MTKPRILLLDIESAPNIGYSWGKWEQNIIQFTENWYIICVGYKWLGEKTKVIMGNGKNDKALCKELFNLLNEANLTITQNGDAFDLKKINTRFLIHGIPPPSPSRSIDILKVARSRFSFNSNKLDDMGKDLDEGRKIEHRGFGLWLDCMALKSKALKEMAEYNKQDVELLERIYMRFRPWIRNHINLANISEVSGCPTCGSRSLQKRGFRYAQTQKYQQLACMTCRAWSYVPLDIKRDFKPAKN